MGSLLLVSKKNCTPHSLDTLIRVEFESTHTEAGLVGVGGLVTGLEACVRITGDFPQKWPQSDLSRFEPLVESRALLLRESILSCLPSECVAPCLPDLLEFRLAEHVPWFADLLTFILIAISVHGEFQQSQINALLLGKVPFGSFPHHFKKDRPILSHQTSSEQL